MSQLIRIHQCISGFTQRENRIHGVFKLAEKLIKEGYADHSDTRVSLRPWNDDWDAVAENAWILGQHHEATIEVQIYAYSWGGGWGAPRLCRELDDRGIRVRRVVLSDPVYRHPNPLLRISSLFSRRSRFAPVIRFPDNIDFIHQLFQTRNRPQGHKVVAPSNVTMAPAVPVDKTHQYMDDAPEFHAAAIAAATRLKAVIE